MKHYPNISLLHLIKLYILCHYLLQMQYNFKYTNIWNRSLPYQLNNNLSSPSFHIILVLVFHFRRAHKVKQVALGILEYQILIMVLYIQIRLLHMYNLKLNLNAFLLKYIFHDLLIYWLFSPFLINMSYLHNHKLALHLPFKLLI